MPITQDQIIELMQESRLAHSAARDMRESVLSYIAGIKQRRLLDDPVLNFAPVLAAIQARIEQITLPSDQATYRNEWHYRRKAKINDKQKELQRAKRRGQGLPTAAENIERLNAINAARRNQTTPDLSANIPWEEQYFKDRGEYPPSYLAKRPKGFHSALENVEVILEPDPDVATPETIHNAIADGGGLFGNDDLTYDSEHDCQPRGLGYISK